MPKLDADEIYKQIRAGVRDAFEGKLLADLVYEQIHTGVQDALWQMITNATQMPCHDFYDSIKDAVKKAVAQAIDKGDLNPE